MRSDICPIKKQNSIDKRVKFYRDLKHKYPDRIPVMIFSRDITIKQYKFLVPEDITFSKFMYEARRQLSINPTETVYAFIENVLIPGQHDMTYVYSKYREDDGFLYIEFTLENAFGAPF